MSLMTACQWSSASAVYHHICSTAMRACVSDVVQGKVGPYQQFVVYEKRRVYIEFVAFYKSGRPAPQLPPVPKVSRSSRHAAFRHRVRSSDRRPSGTESDSDSDNDLCGRSRSRSRSASSVGRHSLSETELPPFHFSEAVNDYFLSADAGDVQKVSVVRRRTQTLLQERG